MSGPATSYVVATGNGLLPYVCEAISRCRIADMSVTDGLFTEGLVMTMTQQEHDVQEWLAAFVNKTAARVRPA